MDEGAKQMAVPSIGLFVSNPVDTRAAAVAEDWD